MANERDIRSRSIAYPALLAGTVAVAIGLRVAFWWAQARSGAVQPGDSEEYYVGAVRLLLRGDYWTGDKWLRPPLYPLFLAATFALTGIDVARAMLVQAVATGLGVLSFGALGRALFDSRSVAVASSTIAAIFVPFAAYGSVLFAEALFVVLIAAFFALLLRKTTTPSQESEKPRRSDGPARYRMGLLAGATLGLATLTRAVGLFFLPLALLGIMVDRRLLGVELRHAFRYGLMVVCGTVLIIAPWTIRNALVYDRFIPVETNGGISFWYGTVFDDAALAEGEALLATIPNVADKQRAALRLALADIARDPVHYLDRVRFKIVSLWQLSSRNYAAGGIVSFDPDGHSLGLTPGELPAPLALLADAQYVLLVLGAIWGYCYAPAQRRSTLLVLWVVFGTVMSGLTIGHPRLRLPLLVPFVPYAAAALVALLPIRRRARLSTRWQPAIIASAFSLLFLGLVYTQHYGRFARAAMVVARGDGNDPERYLHAYAANPANPLWLLGAADRQARAGLAEEAEANYARAAEQEPRSLYAHVRLLASALDRGDDAQAEQELRAIRELGRDTNDLLLWAWSRLDARPSQVLEPSSASAIGNIHGFAPAEAEARERWSLGYAQLRLQPTAPCGRVALRMRGYQEGQPVEVTVGGRRTTIEVTRHQETYYLPLSGQQCVEDAPLVVTLQTPARVVDLETQPWPVGVAVERASIE